MLALGLQAPNEDGRPPAYQSVLLVTGLLLLFPALLRLAAMLGAEDFATDFPAGELTWTSLRHRRGGAVRRAPPALGDLPLPRGDVRDAWRCCPAGSGCSRTRRSRPRAGCCCVAAAGLVLAALALRASAPRQAELLIDAAGVAILFDRAPGVWLTLFAGVALQTGVERAVAAELLGADRVRRRLRPRRLRRARPLARPRLARRRQPRPVRRSTSDSRTRGRSTSGRSP